MRPGKLRGVGREAAGQRGIRPDALAGDGHLFGGAVGEQHGVEPVAQEPADIARRSDHRPPHREHLGQFRGQAVIVERTGVSRLHEGIGEGEQLGQQCLLDKAHVDDLRGPLRREGLAKFRGKQPGADEPGGNAAGIEQRDRLVELPDFVLVGKGVGAGVNEHLLAVAQPELGAQRRIGRLGLVEREIHARRQREHGRAGRHKFAQRIDDHRAAIGHAQKRTRTHRMTEGAGCQIRPLQAGRRTQLVGATTQHGRQQVILVVLQVDERATGHEMPVRHRKASHVFPRRPRVQDIRTATIRETPGRRQDLVVRHRRKGRIGDHADRLLVGRHRDHTRMAARRERPRKKADVVQAVGREVAVVDKEDVHGVGGVAGVEILRCNGGHHT